MINNRSILAIIPARSGSKGLPGKNIKELCGKPLIAWTIEQALICNDIDRLVVSTDDEDIARVAKKFGANVPFIRPSNLAGDSVPIIDVIFHTIDWLKKYHDYRPDYVLLLQPTSPLRLRKDIEGALSRLVHKEIKAVISVSEIDHHPWWSNTLPKDGNMKDFIRPNILNKCRQDLPVFYRLNGAIYAAATNYLYQNNGFHGPKTYAYIMSKKRSIDIDSELDFNMAELALKLNAKTIPNR